jgi:predicted dehydrogenase/threonine dehydrogenase-like Zn-dependent dehydrogenase
MKQVARSLRDGRLIVAEVPVPILRPRGALIRTVASLVSAGTERTAVEFTQKSLPQKVRARPDLAREVLSKAQRDGVLTTVDSVLNRLGRLLPLGYSSAGIVTAVGLDTPGLRVGDRVSAAGAGYANHAEAAFVPRNLIVTLPDDVDFESAAFVTVAAVALQGVRQAGSRLGENVLVIGLGLVGQLSVQLLKAAGCRVFGIDLDRTRVDLAIELGADSGGAGREARAAAAAFVNRRGFDAVLLAADTTGNEPVRLAAELSRDRGVVVAVGAVGLDIPRQLYYEKELELRLSRSYGPGRYDTQYEEEGTDYPFGYVRWTEQRNMEEVVRLLSTGKLRAKPLISHRFPIQEAEAAYELVTGKTRDHPLGVLLTYEPSIQLPRQIPLTISPTRADPSAVRLGMFGAGDFANSTLLPAIRGVRDIALTGIVSASGLSARSSGSRFGFAYCASDEEALLQDQGTNWIAIVTRHDLHASQAIAAMEAGKDVFVEKPLALDRDQLFAVVETQRRTGRRLMVGFNRRFAPMVEDMVTFFAKRQRPLIAVYRVNAGAVPANHWTIDPVTGGGRIIGEACHFFDLLQALTGALPNQVYTVATEIDGSPIHDEIVITISFHDGSVGTVIYSAGGDRSFSKERIEVFGDGKVAVLDDFRRLDLIESGSQTHRHQRFRADKGHRREWQTLVESVATGKPTPIRMDEIVGAHLAAFAALDSLSTRQPVDIDTAAFMGLRPDQQA